MIRIETVEMHTGGEPVRIVTAGFETAPDGTILAKGRQVRAQQDHLRRLLMHEPRRFASVTGAQFGAAVVASERAGPLAAVRVEVAGNAHYTGSSVFTLEDGDDIGKGFLLR